MNQSICVYRFSTDNISNQQETSEDTVVTYTVNNVSKAMLLRLAVQSVRRNVEEIAGTSDINANGSVESIREWARIAFQDSQTHVIDQTQQRAFEVIMSTFVISFHNEADRNVQMTGTIEPHSRSQYNKLRSDLGKLYGRPDPEGQMIMFLTGPGGSGKTKVINSVLSYAKRFCEQMQYAFDKRTIVVMAMSGVAATLIDGETIHSAAKLNCEKITLDHQKEWYNTRMLIVDEISFANSSDLMKLHESLQ
jgi:hypothetical protein